MRLAGAVLALASLACAGWAATPEYQLKAAFLYNFAKFTEWPNGEQSGSMAICVYGKDPFGGFLDEAVRGKLVHGLPILIRRTNSENENGDGCQVLFLGGNQKARERAMLGRLRGRSILTIGESDGFAEAGGMIGLVVDGSRVRFEINLSALADARLKASSQLIEMGSVVGARK